MGDSARACGDGAQDPDGALKAVAREGDLAGGRREHVATVATAVVEPRAAQEIGLDDEVVGPALIRHGRVAVRVELVAAPGHEDRPVERGNGRNEGERACDDGEGGASAATTTDVSGSPWVSSAEPVAQ